MTLSALYRIRSRGEDPYFHLAYEEALLRQVSRLSLAGRPVAALFLWQNARTVVIGRNQNAWRECRTGLLEREGGRLARRCTGGGAVFHDLGNLNVSFLVPRRLYDVERQAGVLLDAVRSLGIPAERSGRNDLLADGRKFSGNAFGFHGEGALHHGTVLVAADTDAMSRYLQPPPGKLEGKGVASVRARVVNLTELAPGVTIDGVADALAAAFAKAYRQDLSNGAADPGLLPCEIRPEDGSGPSAPTDAAGLGEEDGGRFREDLGRLLETHRSFEWRYGQSLPGDAEISGRFPFGGFTFRLAIREGRIRNAQVDSDALDADFVTGIARSLEGVRYRAPDLADALDRAGDAAAAGEAAWDGDGGWSRRTMADALSGWMRGHSL